MIPRRYILFVCCGLALMNIIIYVFTNHYPNFISGNVYIAAGLIILALRK